MRARKERRDQIDAAIHERTIRGKLIRSESEKGSRKKGREREREGIIVDEDNRRYYRGPEDRVHLSPGLIGGSRDEEERHIADASRVMLHRTTTTTTTTSDTQKCDGAESPSESELLERERIAIPSRRVVVPRGAI